MPVTYAMQFVPNFVAHNAPNVLFQSGVKRREWSKEQCIDWFEKSFWPRFQEAIVQSETLTADGAKKQLDLKADDPRSRFIREDMQHRLVRHDGLSYIAQVQSQVGGDIEVNQIWYIDSGDHDPLKICVTFPNEETKARFIALAGEGDKYGTKLLRRLVQEYMRSNGANWD